jgi:hypothetical protein
MWLVRGLLPAVINYVDDAGVRLAILVVGLLVDDTKVYCQIQD